MKPCLLFITCKNQEEADNISNILLQKKLVSCIKKIPIDSSYLWNKKIESNKEILMIMDSIEDNFQLIDEEIKKLHSYDVYTLFMTKIDKVNKKALSWLKQELIPFSQSP